MRQVKLLGLTLMSVFALSAMVVASVSAALPEFEGPFPIHFTAMQLGNEIIETASGRTTECAGSSALGFINGEKDILISNGIIYTGCRSIVAGNGKCQSGSTEGEIKTLPLLGLLGYISKPKVGILFKSVGTADFEKFKCNTFGGEETVLVKGTLIYALTPVNVMTKNYDLFSEQANGIQNPLHFEGLTTVDNLMVKGEGPEPFGFEDYAVRALSDVLTLTLTKIIA